MVLASLGIPSYLKTDFISEIINFGTMYESDPDVRKKNWDFIHSESADPEDIIELLGSPDSFKIIPSRRAMTVIADYAAARVEFAEAETVEGKLEAMTKMRDLAVSVSALSYRSGRLIHPPDRS